MRRATRIVSFVAVCLVGAVVGSAVADQYQQDASCTGTQNCTGTIYYTDANGQMHTCSISAPGSGPGCVANPGILCRITEGGTRQKIYCSGRK